MRNHEEYRLILDLWEQGKNQTQIARTTSIPRCTVRDCILRYRSVAGLEEAIAQKNERKRQIINMESDVNGMQPQLYEAYAYLLGLYLGDGYLARHPRAYKITRRSNRHDCTATPNR